MRRFRDIIESPFPVPTNCLWIKGTNLKGFINGNWVNLGGNEKKINWNDIEGVPDFAAVATTGSYNDLLNKPNIPSTYILPVATSSVLGGVKSATTGTTSGRDYNVQINVDGTMKVNVPWTDNNTTYSTATSSTLGLVKIGYTESGKNYPVELDGDGKMYVNVPWVNTTYSVATPSANGLMSSADKSKLDNIAENANNYTLPNATAILRGGVLMAGAVADTDATEAATAQTVAITVNSLLASLRTAGVINS